MVIGHHWSRVINELLNTENRTNSWIHEYAAEMRSWCSSQRRLGEPPKRKRWWGVRQTGKQWTEGLENLCPSAPHSLSTAPQNLTACFLPEEKTDNYSWKLNNLLRGVMARKDEGERRKDTQLFFYGCWCSWVSALASLLGKMVCRAGFDLFHAHTSGGKPASVIPP